jgi:hypothetical protein
LQTVAVAVFALLDLPETVVVPCAIPGAMPTTATSFVWMKLNPITADTKSRLSFDLDTGDMTVQNVSSLADGGRYFCAVYYGEDQRVIFTHHLVGQFIQHDTLLLPACCH